MMKITVVGRVVNEVQMKTDAASGKPYALLEVQSARRYKDSEGRRFLDVAPVKLYGKQALRYEKMGYTGCRVAVDGNLETTAEEHGFLVKAQQVEYLTFRKPEETDCTAEAQPAGTDPA